MGSLMFRTRNKNVASWQQTTAQTTTKTLTSTPITSTTASVPATATSAQGMQSTYHVITTVLYNINCLPNELPTYYLPNELST